MPKNKIITYVSRFLPIIEILMVLFALSSAIIFAAFGREV